jgi:adenylyltransferase/sulfurtransferase
VPAALALVRAKVREFGVIDPDPVELSNLPRQIIYCESDIGAPKVTTAASRLCAQDSGLQIETHQCELDIPNAEQIISRYGFVIDATDNPAAKFLINDICVALRRPFVYAGVLGMTGQAMTVIPGRTACLRCLFEEPPEAAEIASCREAGIVGPVAGAIAEVEADEAIRWTRGEALALAGVMMTYDATGTGRTRLTQIAARSGCVCGAGRSTADTAGPSGK